MSARIYSSFEQIDTQLEILNVERDLCVYRIRAIFSGTRTPSLASQLIWASLPVAKTLLIPWLIQKVRRRLERR